MAVIRFLAKRIVSIIITTCAIIALSYTLMYYAPGSFFNSQQVAQAAGSLAVQNPKAYTQMLKDFEARYGMDKPLYVQIARYIWNSFTLNFGSSFQNPTTPIMDTLKKAFPISLFLAFGSIVLSGIIGIPLGIIAALRRNSWADYIVSTIAQVGTAVPAYVTAIVFVLLFGVFWPVLPANGWGTPQDAILPIISLALPNVGGIAKYMRGSLLDALRQDYIRTARAKGVPERIVIFKHALRNSMIALITVFGPSLAFTVVGAVWVENIFSIPGLGTLLNSAFGSNDYPLAICSVFILSMLVMITNLLVDLSYSLLDPRVKLE